MILTRGSRIKKIGASAARDPEAGGNYGFKSVIPASKLNTRRRALAFSG
jgi:hypothetical protein